MHFPGARALLGGKSRRPKSFSPKVRNFFMFYVLVDWTPMGGKSRNTGVLGHFGLGRLLALGEIPGVGRKRKIANFQVLGALLGGKSRRPKSFSVRFFKKTFLALADRREIVKCQHVVIEK